MTIHITLPPFDLVMERWDVVNHRHYIQNIVKDRGIYVIFDDLGRVLYVGKSRRIYKRIREHINKAKFAHEIAKIGIMAVEELTNLDIYETHAINTLKPIYNRDKVYKVNPERKAKLEFELTMAADEIERYRDELYDLVQEDVCELRNIDIEIAREGLRRARAKYNRISRILDDSISIK